MTALSKAERKGLQWFADQPGPVAMFDITAPSNSVRGKLERLGMIEKCGKDGSGWLAFVKYQISAAGRAALQDQTQK